VAVHGSSIGVATELAVVGEPRVGALYDPKKPEAQGLFDQVVPVGSTSVLDVQVHETGFEESGADGWVVVAPVEVNGLDVAATR